MASSSNNSARSSPLSHALFFGGANTTPSAPSRSQTPESDKSHAINATTPASPVRPPSGYFRHGSTPLMPSQPAKPAPMLRQSSSPAILASPPSVKSTVPRESSQAVLSAMPQLQSRASEVSMMSTESASGSASPAPIAVRTDFDSPRGQSSGTFLDGNVDPASVVNTAQKRWRRRTSSTPKASPLRPRTSSEDMTSQQPAEGLKSSKGTFACS